MRTPHICPVVCVFVWSLVAAHIWRPAHLHRAMPHQLHQAQGEQSRYISTAMSLQGEYSS